MKHLADKEPATPATWLEQYTVGGWRDLSADVAARRDEAMELLGEVRDTRVLDLGGGVLLARSLVAARAKVTLVDFSPEACRLAQDLEPNIVTVCMDVRRYLALGIRYDTVIAMGLLEYLPPDFADQLFSANAARLLVYVPVGEGYLQYPARITAYSRADLEKLQTAHGWRVVRQHDCREHVFALYGKLE